MKRSKFTESQIFAILKEAESGVRAADLARGHGVSEATIYKWRTKYGGMDESMKWVEDFWRHRREKTSMFFAPVGDRNYSMNGYHSIPGTVLQTEHAARSLF